MTGAAIAALGVLPALDTDTLGLMDKIAGETLLVAGALALAILAGWRIAGEVRDELLAGASPFWQRQVPRILFVLRWVVPPVVAIVLLFSLRETVTAVTDYLSG
jgi:SNF family Na+-dependent transporter